MRSFSMVRMTAAAVMLGLAGCGGDDDTGAEDFGAGEEIGTPNPQIEGNDAPSVPNGALGIPGDSMTNPDRPGPEIQAPVQSY